MMGFPLLGVASFPLESGYNFIFQTQILLIFLVSFGMISGKNTEVAVHQKDQGQPVKHTGSGKHVKHNTDDTDAEQKLGQLICSVPP